MRLETMRSRSRFSLPTLPLAARASLGALAAVSLLMAAPAAWSLGDAPATIPKPAPGTAPGGAGGPGATAQTPDLQAKILYNEGIDVLRRADNAAARADGADDAHTLYSLALVKFERAVRLDPKMHQAWNYLGYSHRKLGDYDASLEAYEQALALRPGYPEAIEYRAEAYLALKRFKDAEQAYLDLFGINRAIADKLLDAMKGWIAAQHSAPAGGDATGVSDLDKWVQERSQIAAQTAALTRAGTAASWR
jgi:tetratricopeptide (TPR) repeat protein